MLFRSLVPLGGLVAGFAAAFLISQIRRTVADRKSLRELTGLPLLGAVTKIETDEARRVRRKRLMAFLATIGSLVGAYGVLITLHLVLARAA